MAGQTLSKTPSWIGPVTLVALVLGFLLTYLWKAPSQGRYNTLYGDRGAQSAPEPAGNPIREKDNEIQKLRTQITELQTAIADRSRQSKVINDDLQELKVFAGLTEVVGPGITIIMRDSPKRSNDPNIVNEYNIHDRDVMTVVNDLWLCGSEAISVNGQRLGRGTSFRCEGPVIYVGRIAIASPVKIEAVGNPDTLYGAMTMQGRYLDNIKKVDPTMIEVTKKDKIRLPSFSGSTESEFAKVAPAK